MKWNNNYPASKLPVIFKKQIIAFFIITYTYSIIFLFFLTENIPYIFFIFLMLFIFIVIFVLLKLYEIIIFPYAIAFTNKKLIWKTKIGKLKSIDYLSIKSIARTYRKSIKDYNKLIPFDEEIYSIIFKKNISNTNHLRKNRWVTPPSGIVLNKENTRILIQKLKEIDPELKNVEIVGWDENAK